MIRTYVCMDGWILHVLVMDSKVIILVMIERGMYCLLSFRIHFLGPANTLICVSNMQMARAMGNPVPTVESSGWIFAHDMDSLYISFFVLLVLGRWMDGYTVWFKNIVGINVSQTSKSDQFHQCSEVFLQLARSIQEIWIYFHRNCCIKGQLYQTRGQNYPDSKIHRTNMGQPGSCRPQMGSMLAPWTLSLW